MGAINKNMRVPKRLNVGPEQQWREEEGEEVTRRSEEPPPAYTMQVPDRLTYAEASDMSQRPLFTPSLPTICGPLGLEPCRESPSGKVFFREALRIAWHESQHVFTHSRLNSPIRRTYSDQSFCRMPPGTPTQLKQALALPRHPSSFRGSGRPLHQRRTASLSTQTTDPQAHAKAKLLPATPLSLLSLQSILQVAKQLGLQGSQRLMQTVSQKYRVMENWSPEEEGGAAVEFIILRRQVMKMSRRLAALERCIAERRNTEVVLFSLLFSACLLNVWLWIRR